MITIHVFHYMDMKQTAGTISGYLKDGQAVELKFQPADRGRAAGIASRIRIPRGTRIEEHWKEESCSLKLRKA